MESSSPDNFPRWAPSPSPSRVLLSPVEDTKIKSNAARDSAENGLSLSCSSMERIFPFSIGFKSTATTSTAYASAVEKLLEAECAYVKSSGTTDIEIASRKKGISLTWEDLWVGVADRKREQRMILQKLTGFAQPGEVLAIMGPSGCGKSTLLDALAGRLSSSTQHRGKILINGRKETLAYGLRNLVTRYCSFWYSDNSHAYVTQDDTLMTTLTVREVVYYSAQLQLPNAMSKAEKKERAETTIREMSLQDSMNTRIGGWSKKGLSGGQKRRVSICVEILTRPKLLFLDEPTSGLDSAASYHVMNRIIKLAHRDGTTVIASIHQPSGEVFELFQNLCLLSSGRTVYFGPASQAEQFFASNGFPCPTLRNPSDHYLRTINKDFDVKGGALEKGSQANFITQCLVLTRRSFVNMYRDLGYYWLRLAIYISLCLCAGTIFHHIGSNFGSIQVINMLKISVTYLSSKPH
ncbi:putative taurine-transporting ATPase [Rosa chinensis]|uniref:Putative taurine-transporting ATPase n=1 Tax=Rosa chinensis TaxID=74649 RepID=A0A2P6RQE1_ROSCH|nr:putative taurine-transporting ATPase [Rosa chinensis]